MPSEEDFPVDHLFDGGDLDCGSGLILLIRENMLRVPAGGLLEIRSTEPTVATELPPWCRMVGHTHVGSREVQPGHWRHFVKRNPETTADHEAAALQADKQQARSFRWSLRARRSDTPETTVYSRNFSWKSGTSLGFGRTASQPSALEQLFGSLLADVMAGFSTRCRQRDWLIDELEATLNAELHNPLAAIGLETGDPSVRRITLVLFVTSPVATKDLTEVWNQTLSGSPVHQTLQRGCQLETRIVFL